MPDISGLNGGVVKATPDGTDLLPIQEVGGLTKPVSIASVATAAAALVPIATPSAAGRMSAADKTKLDGLTSGGGGVGSSPWTTKTANYTALPGDKLRLDATAGYVVITLPASPTASDADIWLQRLDTSANKVLIRSGSNKLNAQTAKDGVFAPTVIQLIERLSYVDATIGWLGQYDRLTYQSALLPTPTPAGSDPLFANVVLLMPMTTASGITDVKGKVATNQGATISTAIVNPFSQSVGVLSFPGNGAQISIAQSSDFAFGTDAMTIDGWLYPTSVPATGDFGFMDTRAAPNTATDWSISGNVSNQIAMYDTSTPFYEYKSPGLILNQWNYICFARPAATGVTTKLWINGALVGSNATRNNAITAGGSLKIGNTVDTITSSHATFTGYMSNIRITRAYRDGSVVPTAPFPNA